MCDRVGKDGDAALFVEPVDARVIQRPPLAVRFGDVRRARVREEEILLVRLVQPGDKVGGASSEAKAPVAVGKLGLRCALGAGQRHVRRRPWGRAALNGRLEGDGARPHGEEERREHCEHRSVVYLRVAAQSRCEEQTPDRLRCSAAAPARVLEAGAVSRRGVKPRRRYVGTSTSRNLPTCVILSKSLLVI